MKKILRISLFSSFLFAMTLGVAGCHFFGGNSQSHDTSKIQLTIGFWPEKSEKRDVAMYNVWKEKFERTILSMKSLALHTPIVLIPLV